MDIFEILDQQHQNLNEVLHRMNGLEESRRQVRKELTEQVVRMLTLHIRIENDLLYPELERLGGAAHEYIEESLGEHELIHRLLRQLNTWHPDFEAWNDRLACLQQACEQDIEVEDTRIFAQARQILTREMQQKLGQQAQEMQRQVGDQEGGRGSFHGHGQQDEASTVERRVGGIGTQPSDPASSTLAGHQGFVSDSSQHKGSV